jgi:hypothetical protein
VVIYLQAPADFTSKEDVRVGPRPRLGITEKARTSATTGNRSADIQPATNHFTVLATPIQCYDVSLFPTSFMQRPVTIKRMIMKSGRDTEGSGRSLF